MKFGVREICDVVLKARAPMKVGYKVFYANEPVLYFDTLKTSSLEGASTTVYAQGGRGNARLVAWDGDRTLTFTMEDALISAEGFMILSGAGLIDATANNTIKQHVTEKTTAVVLAENKKSVQIYTTNLPYEYISKDGKRDGEYYIYAMLVDNDEPVTEPYLPTVMRTGTKPKKFRYNEDTKAYEELASDEAVTEAQNKGETIYYGLEIKAITENAENNIKAYNLADGNTKDDPDNPHQLAKFENGVVLLDYYVEKASKAK